MSGGSSDSSIGEPITECPECVGGRLYTSQGEYADGANIWSWNVTPPSGGSGGNLSLYCDNGQYLAIYNFIDCEGEAEVTIESCDPFVLSIQVDSLCRGSFSVTITDVSP